MSRTHKTILVCDRCSRQLPVDTTEEAIGWHSITAASLATDKDGQFISTTEWEICDRCTHQLRRLLEPTDKPSGVNSQPIGVDSDTIKSLTRNN